ncbi:hypothetical protein Nepgr_027771 [Nepenthes gracilis]|uniref:Uncharacterized protein n=1 Tax=Nepenthes gracilis TaxID=150966 RepID=A0AAD3TB53_NEPGR|nr:hypothetical protein Nepgr_027771 [Nepenthes gracilis]
MAILGLKKHVHRVSDQDSFILGAIVVIANAFPALQEGDESCPTDGQFDVFVDMVPSCCVKDKLPSIENPPTLEGAADAPALLASDEACSLTGHSVSASDQQATVDAKQQHSLDGGLSIVRAERQRTVSLVFPMQGEQDPPTQPIAIE